MTGQKSISQVASLMMTPHSSSFRFTGTFRVSLYLERTVTRQRSTSTIAKSKKG